MERSTWKRSESRMAAALGGKRVPVSGRARGSPDIAHERFAIEHKAGRVLGSRLLLAIQQAEAAGAASGKPWIVTVEQRAGAGRRNRCYVLLALADFLTLTAPGQDGQPPGGGMGVT